MPAQLVIVDDCLTDGSQQIISHYSERFPELITAIYHRRNMGVAHARNTALRVIDGDFVTFLDGDDLFLPEKIEHEVQAMLDDPAVGIVYLDFTFVANGMRVTDWSGYGLPPDGNVLMNVFGREYPRQTLFRSELLRRTDWERVGDYDCSPPLFEDFDMRIRMASVLRAKFLPVALSKYRVHTSGLSTNTSPQRKWEGIMYVYDKNRSLLDSLSQKEAKRARQQFGAWAAVHLRRAVEKSRATEGEIGGRLSALKYYGWYVRRFPRMFHPVVGLETIAPKRF